MVDVKPRVGSMHAQRSSRTAADSSASNTSSRSPAPVPSSASQTTATATPSRTTRAADEDVQLSMDSAHGAEYESGSQRNSHSSQHYQYPDEDDTGSAKGKNVIIVREKAKRGARACVSCRRLKKTCEGGTAPCVRCKQSGTECVFDKPASSVVEDAGLTRLAGIEAALATNERRMDAVVQQMGEMSNVLTDVLQRIKQTVGSQSGTSPGTMPLANHSSPHASNHLDSTGAQIPTPPTYPSLGRPRPQTGGSPGFGSIPQFGSTSHAFSTSPLASTSTLPYQPVRRASATAGSTGSASRASALDALAHLASSASPDVHRFASHMREPIQALQDAVEQLNEGEHSADEGALEGEHEAAGGEGAAAASRGQDGDDKPSLEARAASSTSVHQHKSPNDLQSSRERAKKEGPEAGERPAKRARIARPVVTAPDQFDLVAKGLITDTEARALVLLWMKECQPFCSVLDSNFDTYESLRKRSAFLFNAVVFTALRARERCAPPSKELLAASEETSRFARDQVFQTKPSLEVIQAMMVMACYHQEPYILSGVALRLALVAKLDTTVEQIEDHGWTKTDERAQRLTAQLRTWIYIVTINAQHERNLGRMILMRQEDIDTLMSQADRALSLPFAISSDFRHVANLRLGSIVRSIVLETAVLARQPQPAFGDLISYLYEKKQVLQDWHSHYDTLISSWQPSQMSWPRRSHNRQYHDAQLGLITMTFKQQLLDPPASATYEITQIVQEAIGHARSALQMVLGSPVYRSGTQWSGYLLRTDMSFAGIFLLKSAAAFPHLVDRNELVHEVQQTAELLSTVAGSQKYAAMLSAACNQFLEKTTPPGVAPTDATANGSKSAFAHASHASTPSSSSLRDILSGNGPVPDTTLATSVATPAPSLLPPLAGSDQNTPYPFDVSANGAGMMALMPGEMEIDWSLAVQPTLFDDSILSQHDWAASIGLAGGWQNWTQ
ncbi:hypothetical protein JCM10908_007281 [Rhodotorula pacifica]|uniref:uncharacterized protein n=1 Tax=Rhodotorula pacifica TaxID=1495444 RepID=UPI0031732184